MPIKRQAEKRKLPSFYIFEVTRSGDWTPASRTPSGRSNHYAMQGRWGYVGPSCSGLFTGHSKSHTSRRVTLVPQDFLSSVVLYKWILIDRVDLLE